MRGCVGAPYFVRHVAFQTGYTLVHAFTLPSSVIAPFIRLLLRLRYTYSMMDDLRPNIVLSKFNSSGIVLSEIVLCAGRN